MKKVPFLLRMIQGAVGKRFVVKHYRYGVVVTRYPDMSGVRASAGQRACRDVFGEVVAFAKAVFADAERKAFYREKLGKKKRLFQAVMREYFKRARSLESGVGSQEAKRGKEGKEKKGVEVEIKVERKTGKRKQRGRRGLFVALPVIRKERQVRRRRRRLLCCAHNDAKESVRDDGAGILFEVRGDTHLGGDSIRVVLSPCLIWAPGQETA